MLLRSLTSLSGYEAVEMFNRQHYEGHVIGVKGKRGKVNQFCSGSDDNTGSRCYCRAASTQRTYRANLSPPSKMI